jgi:hypothetical protein
MAQTMELSLDMQSPIQVSNKTASSVITLSFASVGTPLLGGNEGGAAINPTKWSRNTLQEQKPKSETGKKGN